MLGCDSFAIARIVAANLRRNSGDSAISGRTSLTVTGRLELGVLGVGDQRAGARRHHPHDAVAVAEDAPGEAAPGPVGGSARRSCACEVQRGRGLHRRREGYRWGLTRSGSARPAQSVGVSSTPATTARWPRPGRGRGPGRHVDVHGDRCRRAGAAPTSRAPPPARGGAASTRSCWRASLVIAVGLVLIGYGVGQSVTGDEAPNMPAAVEEVTPAFDADPGARSRRGRRRPRERLLRLPGGRRRRAADRAPRRGRLAVDVEPGEQVDFPPGARFEPGNATLTFTPGAEQAVDSSTPACTP